MGLEVLDELDEVVDLLPELEVTVDGDGDDGVDLGGGDDVLDELSVHQTLLVLLGEGQVLEEKLLVIHWNKGECTFL